MDPFAQGQGEGGSDHPAPTLTIRAGAPPAITVQIRPGDTLTSIGRQFGVSPGAIKEANNLRRDVLKVGQNLLIPVQPAPTPEVLQPLIPAAPGTVLAGPENVPVAPQATPQPQAMPVIPGFAFAPGAAPAAAPMPQPASVPSPQIPDSPLLRDNRFDISFENRPAGEVAAMLMEKVPGINIMLPGETGNIIIPSLSLKEVNLAEFMAALTAASQADMSSGNDGYSLDPVPGADNILIFRQIQIHRTATATGYGSGAPGAGGSAAMAYTAAPVPYGTPGPRIYGMGPDGRGRSTPAPMDPNIRTSAAPAPRAESRKGGITSVGGGRTVPGGAPEGSSEGPGGSAAGGGAGFGAPGGMPGSTGTPGLGGGGGEGAPAGFGGIGSSEGAGTGSGLGGYGGGGPVGGAAPGYGAEGGFGGAGGYGGMAMAAAPYQARSESAFLDLSTILGSSNLQVDDITTAIRTAWSSIEGEKAPPEGALKFHVETKLLIITATPEYLHAATSIIALLQSRSEPSQDQKDQAIADMKRQLGEAMDSRARLMKDLDSEMSKLRESREIMQAKVAELEIELAKKARMRTQNEPEVPAAKAGN